MFDALRRAEAQRRMNQDGGVDEPAVERAADGGVDGPTVKRDGHAGTESKRPLGEGELGIVTASGMPEGLLRELGILHNSVENALKKPRKRCVVFTSAGHGEGATTIALGYAQLLAAGGRERVLLIEANARRPSIARRLGLDAAPGFVECVAGRSLVPSTVVRAEETGIDVIPVGDVSAAEIQVQMETGVPRVLEQCKSGWDTVIIDAPPVMTSPETPRIAALADGVVMVLRCGRTKREVVQRALDMIEQVGARNLGIALNRKKYYIPEFIYQRI